MSPGEMTARMLSGGRLAKQVPLASYSVRYAKDKGSFITARQTSDRLLRTWGTASMHTDATSAGRCPSY